MIEKVFSIGDFAISPFGVMLVLAFFAAYLQLVRGLRRLGAGDEDDASSILFAAGIGGILGGKIYYALLRQDWHALFDRAGIVWYGGLIGGFLAAAWVLRRRRLPWWLTLDAAGPAIALGYGVGRIGCFLVGDDYGKPTDLPWGVVFRKGVPPTTAGNLEDVFGIAPPPGTSAASWVAVHPTQLYETLAALLIWGVGLWLLGRALLPGIRFLTVIGLLAGERFAIEFLRAKDDRFFGELTVAQLISAAILVLVLATLARRRRAVDGDGPAPGAAADAGATRA